MGKSEFSAACDAIQRLLRPWMKERGFRARGRAFNRVTSDGLTHVVSLQMGRFDPPGTVTIPGFRENLYGRFTINLGLFVPEVHLVYFGPWPAWVVEDRCCIRARLGILCEGNDLWWEANPDAAVVDDVRERLADRGLPWLARFNSRDRVLSEVSSMQTNWGGPPPRIIAAIMLAACGQLDEARALLHRQATESLATNPKHVERVRELALKLGLGDLDD